MANGFAAQSLVETKTTGDQRFLEMVFVDAVGERHTVSLPSRVAADLAAVLTSLAAGLADKRGPRYTKLPELCAVGRASHDRMVLIRFDDDPPYGLDLGEARRLAQDLQEETETIAAMGEPARH
jgi:hypothetical protein